MSVPFPFFIAVVGFLVGQAVACSGPAQAALNECLSLTLSASEAAACDNCVIDRIPSSQSCEELGNIVQDCPCDTCRDEYLTLANCIFQVQFGFECVPDSGGSDSGGGDDGGSSGGSGSSTSGINPASVNRSASAAKLTAVATIVMVVAMVF